MCRKTTKKMKIYLKLNIAGTRTGRLKWLNQATRFREEEEKEGEQQSSM